MRIKMWAAGAVLSMSLAASAWAADATGKWTWKVTFNQQERVQNLELKQEGEKLTGFMLGRNDQKIEIKEGKIKDNEVSFVLIRARDGQEFKSTYKGKLEGDTIKGKSTFTRDGQEQSRDWVAMRAK
jgi:hypothetical protein